MDHSSIVIAYQST